MRSFLGPFSGLLILALASQAGAFGTASVLGQNREHERITRHALACDDPSALGATDCFQPLSLDQLAGKSGTFGAVGHPDDPTTLQRTTASSHCDNGDYLDPKFNGGKTYLQTETAANNALRACRQVMFNNMQAAVNDAAAMLNASDTPVKSLARIKNDCDFGPLRIFIISSQEKCALLQDFGAVLHATEDFYAHSNFVDVADPGQPISLTNPPGLSNIGPSDWLDLSKTNAQADSAFPPGVITGCYTALTVEGKGCPDHVAHLNLNKDEGAIDDAQGALQLGLVGVTPRGKIMSATGSNFDRAVSAAIADAQRQWATLRALMITKYGRAKAATMICAITHDDPASACH